MSPSESPHTELHLGPPGTTVRLRIVAATNLTEIRVADARFKKVPLPANAGQVEIDLPEGVYQISFRDGAGWQNQVKLLVRPADNSSVVVTQEAPGWLRSAALLSEAETDPGSEFIAKDGPEQGQVAVIAVVRHVPPAEQLPQEKPEAASERWLAGLGLVDENDQAAEGKPAQLSDRAVSQLFHIEPGRWRLHLATGVESQALEMPLIVCPGWSMRVYLPLRAYGEPNNQRANLARASVCMIDPSTDLSRDLPGGRRLQETALLSLSERRQLHGPRFNDLLRELLSGKLVNPMLGLYAGHLLSGSTPEEIDLLAQLVANLTELTEKGPGRNLPASGIHPHPDVLALGLRLAMLRKEPIPTSPFPFPPMLMASWEVILQAARSHTLVPTGSLSDRVAGQLWRPSVWVVWDGPQERPSPASPAAFIRKSISEPTARSRELSALESVEAPFESFERGETSAEGDLFALIGGIPQACALVDTALHYAALRQWFRTTTELSSEERLLGQTVHPVAADEAQQRILDHLRFRPPRCVPVRAAVAWTAERLAEMLHIPASTAGRTALTLAHRLLEQDRQHQLNLKARSPMSRPEIIIPYDPWFLGDGFVVPLPTLTPSLKADALDDGAALDYTHFSLVMNVRRRLAACAACNVDAARLVRIGGGLPLRMDERAGEHQLGPETYTDIQTSQPFLVRPQDVRWGSVSEARLANQATFFCTNTTPEHSSFNQGAWASLEDWLLTEAPEFSYRLCVFSGPILREDDPRLDKLTPQLSSAFGATGDAQVPCAFWKIIVFRDGSAGGDDLSALCFAMRQTETWQDSDGKQLGHLVVRQVTIEAIQRWTGFNFGDLVNVDELKWLAQLEREGGREAEWPLVRTSADILYSRSKRRAVGMRAVRQPGGERRREGPELAVGRRAVAGCGCGERDFDARAAVAALARDLAQLTEAVVAQAPSTGTRTVPSVTERAATPEVGAGSDIAQRVASLVKQAPTALKERVASFAEQTAIQADVARGLLAPTTPDELKRVVGGDLVPTGGFPSCCCVGTATDWLCSGVVIGPDVVLTAAHCGASISRVMVGGNQVKPWLDVGARVVSVRRVIVHPSYRGAPYHENDITVLILAASANVPPAPLATVEQLRASQEVKVVGFGYNDPQRPLGFGTKRQVSVPLLPIKLSPDDDLGQLPAELGFHEDYELVAGRKGLGRDSCNGDSGGPVYVSSEAGFALAGLTSRATLSATRNCGDGGIYVRPAAFREWINEVLAASGLGGLS
jgi:endonuclease G